MEQQVKFARLCGMKATYTQVRAFCYLRKSVNSTAAYRRLARSYAKLVGVLVNGKLNNKLLDEVIEYGF